MESVGLADGVTPLGCFQIDVRPFGSAQLSWSDVNQGSQAQGATHDECPFVAVQHSQQWADLLRIGDGGEVCSLDRWQRASKITRRIALGTSGSHGVAKDLATVLKGMMGSF